MKLQTLQKVINESRLNPSSTNSRILQGSFMEEFNYYIIEKEQSIVETQDEDEKYNKLQLIKTRLVATNNLYYDKPKKTSTDYIRITAYCSHCKKVDPNCGKYKIIIKTNPFVNNEDVARVLVEYSERYHVTPKPNSSASCPVHRN